MATTVSRLKNTDSLVQWADKVNDLISTLETFLTNSGSFASVSPTSSHIVVYNGSSWINYTTADGDMQWGVYAGATGFYAKARLISGATSIGGSVDKSNDYLLLYDASEGQLRKVTPQDVSSPGGSDTQIQFNDSGSFLGATAFIYNKSTGKVTLNSAFSGAVKLDDDLAVDTNVLKVDTTNNRVGINKTSPSYDLDVTGNVNVASGAFKLEGVTALARTGGLTSLTVDGGTWGSTGITTTVPIYSGTSTVSRGIIYNTMYITGSTGAVPGNGYIVGATSLTVTLPSSATTGDRVSFIAGSTGINNYTVGRNGNKINGSSTDLTVDMYASFDLIYNSNGTDWVLS